MARKARSSPAPATPWPVRPRPVQDGRSAGATMSAIASRHRRASPRGRPAPAPGHARRGGGAALPQRPRTRRAARSAHPARAAAPSRRVTSHPCGPWSPPAANPLEVTFTQGVPLSRANLDLSASSESPCETGAFLRFAVTTRRRSCRVAGWRGDAVRSVSSLRHFEPCVRFPAHGSPMPFTAGIRSFPGWLPGPEGPGSQDDSVQGDQTEMIRGDIREDVPADHNEVARA
jgi:hypothetical protein